MVSVVMLGDGMMPAMVPVKLLAAQMRALECVSVGMVKYLCLKNMELQIIV